MKRMFFVVIISLMTIPAFSQFVMFEQDIRGQERIPTSQFQWDQPVVAGFSMGPYFLTTTGWHEGFWYFNYNVQALSFGLGTGAEQIENEWSFRVSPWVKFAPELQSDSTKSIALFSIWEIGKGKSNYWYSNQVTYENSNISVGAMARRFYGVGPLLGCKMSVGDWNLKLSLAPLYDFEDNTLKPTVILTVTN